MYIEADCFLIKKGGQIIGISLIAQPQTEAEMFCASMPKQIVDGGGDIKFEDGKITFVNPCEGDVSFSIKSEDASALRAILNGNRQLGLYRDGMLTSGFKIVLDGMEEEDERVELTRL